MPEYLAPGVYVEETSFRPKSIEGVSTSTAGFVGPTRFGPSNGEPPLLTSFADFERIYGGLDELNLGGTLTPNYLAHGVRAFFEEGGRRLYVARVHDGAAKSKEILDNEDNGLVVNLIARYPGEAGDMRIRVTASVGQDVLVEDADGNNTLRGMRDGDSLLFDDGSGDPTAVTYQDVVLENDGTYKLKPSGGGAAAEIGSSAGGAYPVTVSVSVERPVREPQQPGVQYGIPEVVDGLTLSSQSPGSFLNAFPEIPATQQQELSAPFYVKSVDDGGTPLVDPAGADVLNALFGNANGDMLPTASPEDRIVPETQVVLADGTDGAVLGASAYQGDSQAKERNGLAALEDIEDISIVAAPGYSSNKDESDAVQGFLISHAERMRYRIAVLDAQDKQGVTDIQAQRSKVDSRYAALYYPWVTVYDPVTRGDLNLPPSGFIAGIYARNDVQRGVQKAPANEVVRLATGLETRVNKAQQAVLNPDGINCLRFFENRGFRVWGARTISSDPEFKYVNVRRYLAYLERSIDEGTQVFVFESNGDNLWRNVQRTVASFLENEWRSDRLMGRTTDEAFFVRCDRTTMTQNDIDNGRLICEVGVALLKPAEFVIFRVGQKLIDFGG